MKGTVKWFDDKKGYGFIECEDGHEVYVHYSNIECEGFKSLKHNWKVEFEIVALDNGKEEARRVVIIR